PDGLLFSFLLAETTTTPISTLSLHDALPIFDRLRPHEITARGVARTFQTPKLFGSMTVLENVLLPALTELGREGHRPMGKIRDRSEEHTSELQSPCNLVCRLLLEKKKRSTRR